MNPRLWIDILAQPDLTTCGPTCLHAVYRYYGDDQPLGEVIDRTAEVQDSGTLAVMLGTDALRRGYGAAIHTFNLTVFDPTWFQGDLSAEARRAFLQAKLEAQVDAKSGDAKLCEASAAYLEFLHLGGDLTWGDLTRDLLRDCLRAGDPILAGLSSTYLYQESREVPSDGTVDDVRGTPAGHFVVLSGFDEAKQLIQVADPLEDNPAGGSVAGGNHHYSVPVDRAICSILLGVLTYDANLLRLFPPPL